MATDPRIDYPGIVDLSAERCLPTEKEHTRMCNLTQHQFSKLLQKIRNAATICVRVPFAAASISSSRKLTRPLRKPIDKQPGYVRHRYG